MTENKKIKIGWFSFSCCEDNTIVMTEVMNEHWREWKKIFDFTAKSVQQISPELSYNIWVKVGSPS